MVERGSHPVRSIPHEPRPLAVEKSVQRGALYLNGPGDETMRNANQAGSESPAADDDCPTCGVQRVQDGLLCPSCFLEGQQQAPPAGHHLYVADDDSVWVRPIEQADTQIPPDPAWIKQHADQQRFESKDNERQRSES